MYYATLGGRKQRRRRHNKMTNMRHGDRQSMPSTAVFCHPNDQQPPERRKYVQTNSGRSKSPAPTRIDNRYPIHRSKSRVQSNMAKRRVQPVCSYSDKRRLARHKQVRPRKQYQEKQNKFHKQMTCFDLLDINNGSEENKYPSGANEKDAVKYIKAVKEYFFVNGSKCKKYSNFLLSKFRANSGGSIRCQDLGESNGTMMSENSTGKNSSSEYSLVVYKQNDDTSEMSQSENGSVSSLTFSHVDSLLLIDDDYSQTNSVDDDQFIKILLEENKHLRNDIHGLRRDFEVMLNQIQMITLKNEEDAEDEESIQTYDSRVSYCLRKIEELQLLVEQQQEDNEQEVLKREMESFAECIEDLLCENELLYNNILTLTEEREDILKELQNLRKKQEDYASSCTIPHYMQTDEAEARSQQNDLDEIALLLRKMKVSNTDAENKNVSTEVEDYIISLVSDIMTKQRRQKRLELELHTVPEEDRQEEDISNDGVDLETCQHFSENVSVVKSDKVDCKDEYEGDVIGVDGDQADPDLICMNSSCSDRTYKSSSSDDSSEDLQAYYEVSADSLMDMKYSAVHSKRRRDDSSGAMEIIYEYYSSDSSTDQEQDNDEDYYQEMDSPRERHSSSTIEYSLGSIESAEYYNSRSRSSSTSRSSPSQVRSTRSASRSSATSASRSRSVPRPRSYHRDRTDIASRRYSSSSRRSPSSTSDSNSEHVEAENCFHLKRYEEEEQMKIAKAINKQLDLHLFSASLRGHTPSSTYAPISATGSTLSSFSDDSTKENKAITITISCRSSRHISFPSTPEHTYVASFNVAVSKGQVDVALEEQLSASKTIVDSYSTSSFNASDITYFQSNCTKNRKKSKKYIGECNEDGQRHGYGIYKSKNGNEYRGEWFNNKREGLGVVKVGNGDIFEGQFVGNQKFGVGVYHYLDGECDLSRYEDDHRVGHSLRWSSDRKHAFLVEEFEMLEISLKEADKIAVTMGIVVTH